MRRPSLFGLLLVVWLVAIPAAALAASADADVESITIDAATHELVLAGTVTCTEGATLNLGFAVIQGPAFVDGFQELTCTGSGQTWEFREPIGEPAVHPGPATLEFGWTIELNGEGGVFGRSLEAFIAPSGAPWLSTVEAL